MVKVALRLGRDAQRLERLLEDFCPNCESTPRRLVREVQAELFELQEAALQEVSEPSVIETELEEVQLEISFLELLNKCSTNELTEGYLPELQHQTELIAAQVEKLTTSAENTLDEVMLERQARAIRLTRCATEGQKRIAAAVAAALLREKRNADEHEASPPDVRNDGFKI